MLLLKAAGSIKVNNMIDFLTEDQRLVILRILLELPSYKANSSTIRNMLAVYGHDISRDKVKTELSWLAEQGLVKTEILTNSLLVTTLTSRGEDVATGRATVAGVNRPGA